MENQPSQYRERLRQQLTLLSPRQRAAFAALCAERQYGTYAYVSNHDARLRPDLLRRAIDRCWAFITGTDVSTDELIGLKNNVDGLIPDFEEDDSSFASLVLNASATVSYLLNVCLTGCVEDAAYAGECSRNAVDEWVAGETALSSSADDFADHPIAIYPHETDARHAEVDAHPLMVEEMRAQAYALDYLFTHKTINSLDCDHLRKECMSAKSNIGLE